MISQIFFLSARGDSIINRDFRSDLIKNTPELFYRKVKLSKGDIEPIFNIEGINFAYLKKSSIYVVATTRFNISPSYILELLNRIIIIIKDFCGAINEEVIRKKLVLIYEILDEIIDFGHPQLTNTSHIKPLIASEVVEAKSTSILDIKKLGNFSIFGSNTINSSASTVSVNSKTNQNEIFIDIYEKINILFNSSGYVINSSIDGCIQMKSYLLGNPALKLILNDDITLAETNTPGSIILDDCNFHETVQHNEFLTNKALKITPPEGEFIVMNYRITTDFSAPFKVFAFF
jgi:AP-4 complex subunit mu-1